MNPKRPSSPATRCCVRSCAMRARWRAPHRARYAALDRLRPTRRVATLQHQQLQFGDRWQVVGRAAQIAHPAGSHHRLLDAGGPVGRAAAVVAEVDGRQHPAIGAAHREGDMDDPQQVKPVAHLLRIAGLAEPHQRQFGQNDVVGQRLAQLTVDPAFVGGEDGPRQQIPINRQFCSPLRTAPPALHRPAGKQQGQRR